jgi:uncharacterized membrane protein YgcG
VHPDGTLDVAEKLTIHFTGHWNGIVRDISLHHNTAQGRPTKLQMHIVGIADTTGDSPRVDGTTKDRGWTESFKIWVPGADNADRTVVIRYRIDNAIRFFFAHGNEPAFDELYWNVTGNAWTMPIDHVHTHVVLPDGVTPTRTAVYTGDEGSTVAGAAIASNGNEVDFNSRYALGPGEGMTIGVGWPPGHISTRPASEPDRYVHILRWLPLLAPLIVFILAFRAWNEHGRDPKQGTITVQYTPVEGSSPAESGTLLDNKADMQDITATLVDLAVRGFIRIEEVSESHLLGLSKSTDYIFHLLRDPSQWTSLKQHEQCYLDKLSELAPIGESSVKLSEMKNKFYGALPKIRDGIYDELVSSGYYIDRPDKVQAKWGGLAVLVVAAGAGTSIFAIKGAWMMVSPLVLIAATVVSAIIMFVFAALMPARTVAGARAREATLGFKEFLSRVEEDRYKKMITSPQQFETFLPYAMAFGVADKWAKAFENIYREPPTWYVGGTGLFNASTFSHSISNMSTAAGSSMSSSPSSSGSGGGGSSGGGSGGGGGSGF